MDDFFTARSHEERRLLHHIVANVDHQIRPVDGAVNKIAGGQGCIAHVTGVTLINHALTHLSGEERNARHIHQMQQGFGYPFTIGAGTNHDQWMMSPAQHVAGHIQALLAGRWPAGITGVEDMNARFGRFLGNVLRELQVHSTGAFFRGKAKGFSNLGGDGVGVTDLAGVFGERPHQIHHIQNLKQPLLGGLDGLLAGNHHHGHAAQLGVGGSRHQVGGARPKRGQANSHLASQSPIGRRHETGSLFVPIQHQTDTGIA